MRPSAWHIVIVILVILLIFGASRLPGLARNLGKSMKIFRDEVRDFTKDEPAAAAPKDPSSLTPPQNSAGQPSASPERHTDDDTR